MYVNFGPGIANIRWKSNEGYSPLYRSEAPHDGFEFIADVDLSLGFYKDIFEENINKFRYYKLGDKLINMYDDPDPISKEIVRRDQWFLANKRYSGATFGYILIKRTEGERCDFCYDHINNKIQYSYCPVCYGTGFKNPYFAPLKIFFAIGAPKGISFLSPEKNTAESYDQIMWMSNEPLLKPNDILAHNGILYSVVGPITYSRKGLYITKQVAPLRAIDSNRVEYQIPISDEQ